MGWAACPSIIYVWETLTTASVVYASSLQLPLHSFAGKSPPNDKRAAGSTTDRTSLLSVCLNLQLDQERESPRCVSLWVMSVPTKLSNCQSQAVLQKYKPRYFFRNILVSLLFCCKREGLWIRIGLHIVSALENWKLKKKSSHTVKLAEWIKYWPCSCLLSFSHIRML